MERVKFVKLEDGGNWITANGRENILLVYFISEFHAEEIDEFIAEVKSVQTGEKSFEEVFDEVYGPISISSGAGIFECDKEKAYLISKNPDQEPSVEMPIEELIGLLEQWKLFGGA